MNLNDALRQLSTFVKQVEFQPQPDVSGLFSAHTVLISRDNITVLLSGTDADNYTNCVDAVFEAVAGREHLSKKAVERLIEDFVVKVFSRREHEPAVLETELPRLKGALLAEPAVWEIYAAVEGIAHVGLPFSIGQVEFSFCDDRGHHQLAKKVIEASGTRPERRAEAGVKFTRDTQGFLNRVIAKLPVRAVDINAAHEPSQKKLRAALDVINFYAAQHESRFAFLPGDAFAKGEVTLALHSENSRVIFHRVGPLQPVELQRIAQRPGFGRASSLFREGRLSDLEERIAAAMQWAGRAAVEARREEAFLLYAISLESLLLGPGDENRTGAPVGREVCSPQWGSGTGRQEAGLQKYQPTVRCTVQHSSFRNFPGHRC